MELLAEISAMRWPQKPRPTRGRYLTAALVHEDPRYYPDPSRNPLHRVFYALAFTVVDRSTAGERRLAFSNAAGSLAGGFVDALISLTGTPTTSTRCNVPRVSSAATLERSWWVLQPEM